MSKWIVAGMAGFMLGMKCSQSKNALPIRQWKKQAKRMMGL